MGCANPAMKEPQKSCQRSPREIGPWPASPSVRAGRKHSQSGEVMLSSQLQDPDYKLRHAGKSRAPELPRKRALSEIAQRFAPDLQREENEEAGLLEPPSRSAPTAETRRGQPLKALTAAAIVGALIPTIIFAALWGQG